MDSNFKIYTAALIAGISLYPNPIFCENKPFAVNDNSKDHIDIDDEAEILRLKLAAKSNSGEAAYQLGKIYKIKFEEDQKNYNLELEAIYYFNISAIYNHPEGTFEAGNILVDYDEDEGMELLQKAISLGSKEAIEVYKNMKIALEVGELSGC